jgi:hypothetical protein
MLDEEILKPLLFFFMDHHSLQFMPLAELFARADAAILSFSFGADYIAAAPLPLSLRKKIFQPMFHWSLVRP